MKIIKLILKSLLIVVGILVVAVIIMAAFLFIQINRNDGQTMTPEGPRNYLLHIPESYDHLSRNYQ